MHEGEFRARGETGRGTGQDKAHLASGVSEGKKKIKVRDLGFPLGGLPRSPAYLVHSHSVVQDLVCGGERLNIRLLSEILPKAWSSISIHPQTAVQGS